jgi:DNA-binding transcriptional LysR family regulator
MDLYPGIEIDLILNNEELDLAMRQADCAIRLRQPQQPDLIQRRLFTVHFHVFASPGYIRRFGRPETVDDLKDHRLITWGDEAPGYLKDVNWLVTAGLPGGERRASALKINSILAIKRAVLMGAGIAMLPDYSVEEDSALVPVMADIDVPSFDTYFAYSAELKNSARLNAFRDFLFSQARSWSY